MGSVNLELVDEFVGIIKNNWYKRDSVNWDSFTKKVIKNVFKDGFVSEDAHTSMLASILKAKSKANRRI